jgi:hypothetical protein
MEEGGAQVVAKANRVRVADVSVSFGSEHDNLCVYTDMYPVPLHSAADIDPTTKGYSVIALARASSTADAQAG